MRKNIFVFLFCFLCFQTGSYGMETFVYFSADVDLTLKFVEQIDVETNSIRMAYCRLSEPKIIEALVLAQKRGVLVEVIVDRLSVTRKSLLRRLAQEGVRVLVWEPRENKKSHMYHAFCIFGEDLVWIGPCAFRSPLIHRESACVIRDRGTDVRFTEEFERIRSVHAISLADFLDKKNFN